MHVLLSKLLHQLGHHGAALLASALAAEAAVLVNTHAS